MENSFEVVIATYENDSSAYALLTASKPEGKEVNWRVTAPRVSLRLAHRFVKGNAYVHLVNLLKISRE